MIATTFVSSASASANCCLLPPLPRTQDLNFSYVSSSTRNLRRCVIGTKHSISDFHRVDAVGRGLESSGVPTSVPVRVALELLQAGHHYLDVRYQFFCEYTILYTSPMLEQLILQLWFDENHHQTEMARK